MARARQEIECISKKSSQFRLGQAGRLFHQQLWDLNSLRRRTSAKSSPAIE